MARKGDLCMCIGAGAGTNEKPGGGGSTGASDSDGGAEMFWDPEKLEVGAKGHNEGAKAKGEALDGLLSWEGEAGTAEGEVAVGPGGVRAKGEGAAAKGNVQFGDEENHQGIEVKVLAAEAEGEDWVGSKDGKYGGAKKGKAGADAVAVKYKSKETARVGDIAFERTSEYEWAKGVDGPKPMGTWATYDPENGELTLGGYVEVPTPFGDIEVLKQYKLKWKPGGSGAASGMGEIPNAIAEGSPDVLLG